MCPEAYMDIIFAKFGIQYPLADIIISCAIIFGDRFKGVVFVEGQN